jgi:hypothetical protein
VEESEMSFKRIIICFILLHAFLFPQSDTILVDKIVAVVNNEIITHLDIDKAIQFYPLLRRKNESDRDFYFSVLQDLINYKVIYLEYKDEFILSEEDYTEVQTAIIKKVGSYDKLMRLLRRFDMEWQDFKDFIMEKVAYEKVLRETFQLKININFQDIVAFYNEQYLPSQRSLRLKPKTMIEMAPLIETQLKKDRTDETLAEWLGEITASYKIENKLLEEQKGNNDE